MLTEVSLERVEGACWRHGPSAGGILTLTAQERHRVGGAWVPSLRLDGKQVAMQGQAGPHLGD